MTEGHAIDVRKHVRAYILVFVALAVLTVITVAVSYLKLSLVPAVLVALFVATVKGSLVACFFMHLIDERKLIYSVLALTVVFFAVLMSLPLLTEGNQVFTPATPGSDFHYVAPKQAGAAGHGAGH
jgi:cytochrome c oxidase subunit 4